jgi:site-specific recombinase XerD
MTDTSAPLPLPEIFSDWTRNMRARGLARTTITSYLQVGLAFTAFLESTARPADARTLRRADIEDYLIGVREQTSPANEHKHHRQLKQFFRWLVDVEEELVVSPMAKIDPPRLPKKPIPIVRDDAITAVLEACAGRGFLARRDTAIIRLFADTGMRLGELAGLGVDDLDWSYEVAHVLGKGSKRRACPFGPKTGDALRRYLRIRSLQPHTGQPALWIGRMGPLTDDGIARMIRRRAREAGLGHLHPHQFRHTAAHIWLANGGQEVDLMRLMGWSSRRMVSHYAESAADERAREAHHRMALGDRL